MFRLFRFQAIILFTAVIILAVYGFASSETNIPSSGEGAHTISGWTVSNVQYHLVDNTANIASVDFDLDGLAGEVRVGFGSLNNVSYDCANTSQYHWDCDIHPQIEISELNELQVVALGK